MNDVTSIGPMEANWLEYFHNDVTSIGSMEANWLQDFTMYIKKIWYMPNAMK